MSERTWNPGDPDVLPEVEDPRRYGARVDTSARDAAAEAGDVDYLDDYLDGDLQPCLDVPLSPDCAVGKCDACSGDTWNTAADALAPCPHPCHPLPAR